MNDDSPNITRPGKITRFLAGKYGIYNPLRQALLKVYPARRRYYTKNTDPRKGPDRGYITIRHMTN